jgi:DNA-binding LytR/AlgR family response regulator
MKFAIIDDEKKATDLIETYITEFVTENHFEIQTRVFHNPAEFLESYTKDYDLVFLDVKWNRDCKRTKAHG